MLPFDDLDTLHESLWRRLATAERTPDDPWALVSLSTIHGNAPRQRILMIRDVNAAGRELWLHTDRRSHKLEEIAVESRVSLLLYDAQLRTQVVLSGHAEAVTEENVLRQHWEAATVSSRRAYLAPFPPGTPTAHASVNLPDDVAGRLPTAAELASAFPNFAVIRVTVSEIDVLKLQSQGNLRAHFSWSNGWDKTWLEP